MSLVVYGGLILFSAFLLYDTQRVVKQAELYPHKSQYGNYYGNEMTIRSFDPINALVFFFDFRQGSF